MNAPASLRSIPSNKSGKSVASVSDTDEVDLEHVMTELYKRFNCPIAVSVGKEYQHRDHGTKTREGKTKFKRVSAVQPEPTEVSENLDQMEDPEKTLAMAAIYDHTHRLIEIRIAQFRSETIPRIVIQLFGLVLPNYSQLSKLTIKNCLIDMFTVHELSKVLPSSTITEVCLDDCPLEMANYELLLKNPSFLKTLSLCRCQINDAVCERIASKLCYLESAEKHLTALNLTSNNIGDIGAKHFSEALRSNRHLRYLNLADNHITDEGANYIFHTLIEFPLTYDENMDRKHRYMLYLKKKLEIYYECLHKFDQARIHKSPIGSRYSVSTKRNSLNTINTQKRSSITSAVVKNRASFKKERAKSNSVSEENIPLKAELMAKDLVGAFVDPFCPDSVRIEDGYPRCIGNLALCYLNMAYNELTYASVTKLLSVVEYQQIHSQFHMCGIMKVILEGNYLPENCIELTTISHILNKHMACFHSKMHDKGSATRKTGIERKYV